MFFLSLRLSTPSSSKVSTTTVVLVVEIDSISPVTPMFPPYVFVMITRSRTSIGLHALRLRFARSLAASGCCRCVPVCNRMFNECSCRWSCSIWFVISVISVAVKVMESLLLLLLICYKAKLKITLWIRFYSKWTNNQFNLVQCLDIVVGLKISLILLTELFSILWVFRTLQNCFYLLLKNSKNSFLLFFHWHHHFWQHLPMTRFCSLFENYHSQLCFRSFFYFQLVFQLTYLTIVAKT